MKKKVIFAIIAVAVIAAIIICMSAVLANGKKGETQVVGAAQLANPIHECTRDELIQKVGIDIAAPENAKDVTYSYIDIEGSPVAQVFFTLDKHRFNYRAQATSVTALNKLTGDVQVNNGNDLLDKISEMNEGEILAGLYEDWQTFGTSFVGRSREAVFAFQPNGVGYIAWLDVVPGILYSLSVDKGANQQLLETTANAIFVPVQGDA